METIGIIAGRGNFPIILARQAKRLGYSVVAVCIKENTKKCLRHYVDKLYWLGVTEFKRIAQIFKQENVLRIAMAGQVNPYSLLKPKVMLDHNVRDFFGSVPDRRADTIFSAFTRSLEKNGLELLDSTMFLNSYMPAAGTLSRKAPSEAEKNDVDLGFRIAKNLGAVDIGQSVCVKDGVILAVEAIEGTDNTIRRAWSLARQAIVLVKAAKPNQDMRFDVPVVGFKTIKNLPKGSCLAIEASKTLFLDMKEALNLADKKGIAIYAVDFNYSPTQKQ